MDKPQFDYVKRKDGTSEFEDFLNSIPEKDSSKLLAIAEYDCTHREWKHESKYKNFI